MRVALLTGGQDKSYALGMVEALTGHGISVDYVGSDLVDDPSLHANPMVRPLNIRGSQTEDSSLPAKVWRILRFYLRFLFYIATDSPKLVHVLWHDKFEYLARTLLMAFYVLCGKCVILTAHNVNTARRDGRDSFLNRLTLRIQYRLASLVVVHTLAMRRELQHDFGVPDTRVIVVPFGLNDTTPRTGLSRRTARERLGLGDGERVLLFFGQIAPYKGLVDLLRAVALVRRRSGDVRLVIAGKIKNGHEGYWSAARTEIDGLEPGAVLVHDRFIADEEVESYFVAADAVVLPYREIYQSGVPFLAYSFGLPVIATRVGALPEDISEGVSGFLAEAGDPVALADAIERFYQSELYRLRDERRAEIRKWALAEHSWSTVGTRLAGAYHDLAGPDVATIAQSTE